MSIDLNCDCGESLGAWQMGNDAELLPWVSSANIACGFHAGDPVIALQTIDLCLRHGVRIGAHPGLRDLHGFGRRALAISPHELHAETLYQVAALRGLCRARNTTLAHVKAHGALYHLLDQSPEHAAAFVAAITSLDPQLSVFGTRGAALDAQTRAAGLHFVAEGFVERGYQSDGRLLPRSTAGAVLHDHADICAQARSLALEGGVRTQTGWLAWPVQTLCIHGDRADAVELARTIRTELERAGVRIQPPSRPSES